MRRVLRSLILTAVTVTMGCAPDSRHEGSKAVTTYEPPRPTVVQEDGYRIARGATRIQDVTVHYDTQTKSMSLKGKIEYLPTRGSVVQSLSLDLAGLLEHGGYITLKNRTSQTSSEELQVAAKATCLSSEGCASSFIDIYIYTDGVIYHHQIESHQEEKQEEVQEQEPAEKDELESEGGADEVEGEPGQYVGSIKEDIETLLKVTPVEEPKKEEPKKDEPKKEEPKKEEPKKEDPKKEEPKKEEPKKETPKPEDPKKDTPKEQPKKDEPKKEEPKEVPHPTPRPSIPKSNQAIGPVNNGRLENGVNMLKYEQEHSPSGFHIIRPQRLTHFATNELAYLISQMGKLTQQEIPGYVLSVGDISREKGGKLGSHKSHQNGLDADIAFYFNNKSFQGYFASAVAVDKPHANWMIPQQWKLFKSAVQTQLVDRIFIHKVLKKALCNMAIENGELQKGQNSGVAYETLRRLIPDADHNNHFHIRVKCSSAQVRCRQMAEPAPGSGCF